MHTDGIILVVVTILWYLDLQLPVQSVPITTKVSINITFVFVCNSLTLRLGFWCLSPFSTIYHIEIGEPGENQRPVTLTSHYKRIITIHIHKRQPVFRIYLTQTVSWNLYWNKVSWSMGYFLPQKVRNNCCCLEQERYSVRRWI
jgi:hypothetical protein